MTTEEQKSTKRRIVIRIIAVILVIVSLGLAGYPLLSDFVNEMQVRNEGVVYDSTVRSLDKDQYKEIWESARQYNNKLKNSNVFYDPFGTQQKLSAEYDSQLRLAGTQVMAAVEIPKIKVDLPVYHGTSTDVLARGVGHLACSSLPVGGKGTHAVLTGHTGFSRQKLFSDLNLLKKGDVFFIRVLGEKLAYEVDEIRTVLPDEIGDIAIDPQQDYVTLITCTPFGINSHRLLVRGKRTELAAAEEAAAIQSEENSSSTWQEEYLRAAVLGVLLFAILLVLLFGTRSIVRAVRRARRNKAEQPADGDER